VPDRHTWGKTTCALIIHRSSLCRITGGVCWGWRKNGFCDFQRPVIKNSTDGH
jgi:hypothetical protein